MSSSRMPCSSASESSSRQMATASETCRCVYTCSSLSTIAENPLAVTPPFSSHNAPDSVIIVKSSSVSNTWEEHAACQVSNRDARAMIMAIK
eukprot:3533018-Rhodomonas_salina.1